jgi:hypothetical protein
MSPKQYKRYCEHVTGIPGTTQLDIKVGDTIQTLWWRDGDIQYVRRSHRSPAFEVEETGMVGLLNWEEKTGRHYSEELDLDILFED